MDVFEQTRAAVVLRCRKRDRNWRETPPKINQETARSIRKKKLRSKHSLDLLQALWAARLPIEQVAEKWSQFHSMPISVNCVRAYARLYRDRLPDRRCYNTGRPKRRPFRAHGGGINRLGVLL